MTKSVPPGYRYGQSQTDKFNGHALCVPDGEVRFDPCALSLEHVLCLGSSDGSGTDATDVVDSQIAFRDRNMKHFVGF